MQTAETASDRNNSSAALRWLRFALPSVADLIFIILLATMSAGVLAPRLLGDAGIGWHIRNGELMSRAHSITRTDPFSSTLNGQPWFAWEWVYDALIAAVHEWLGLNGVVFCTALIVAATFALTFRLALRRGATLAVAVPLLALCMGASSIHFLARPHVLSWVLAVIWLQLVDCSQNADVPNTRQLWGLPVLMLFWANLHGGFVLGFALLGIYLLSGSIEYFRGRDQKESALMAAKLKKLAGAGVLALMASLVNPFGYKLHVHVYRYLTNRWLMDHIDEFLSPNFHGLPQQCFALLLGATIVALAAARRKPPLAHWLVILFLLYSGLYASRNLPVSALLLTLIIAPLLSQALPSTGAPVGHAPSLLRWLARVNSLSRRMDELDTRFRGFLWPALAVILGLWICLHQGRLGSHQCMDAHFDGKRFPVQAAEVIAQRGIQAPIFAPDAWGGYLIYRLYPQTRVFVDDRHDLYGDEFLKNYLKAIRVTPDWDTMLNEQHVNWVLVPADSSLANMLKETPQWRSVYEDGTAILFQRMTTP